MLKRAGLALVLALAVAACGTSKPRPARLEEPKFTPDVSENVVYLQPAPVTTRSVVTKSYTVGTRRRAAVGEPMVGMRNYIAADKVVGAVVLQPFQQYCRTPEEAGTLDVDKLACRSGKLAALKGWPGDRFDVAGSINEFGNTYYFVRIPASSGDLYLAVDATGRAKSGHYVAWARSDPETTPIGVPVYYQDTPVPLRVEGPIVRFETEETIAPEGNSNIHYEVIYGGTTYDYRGMVYHLLYKEYQREDTQRPIYQQDLEFVGNVTTFDVLGLRVRVHDVNENEIIYTVLRD